MGAQFSKISQSKTELHEAVNGLTPPGRTINDCLRYNVDTKPDNEAFVFVSTDGSRESITWKTLYDNARKMADFLIDSGIGRNEFVAISMGTCPEWLYVLFGALLAGIPAVSMVFTYKDGSDVIAMMEKLKTCSILFMDHSPDDRNWKIVSSLTETIDGDGTIRKAKLTGLKRIICRDPPVGKPFIKTIQQIVTSDSINTTALPEVHETDIAYLFQTSGSTGVPKLAVHTHKSVTMYMRNIHEAYPHDDVMFNDRPFTWIGGFPFTVVTGQTRVTTPSVYTSPRERLTFFIDVVKKERCTSAFLLPPLLIPLMKMKDQFDDGWPLKAVMIGGMPLTKVFGQCLGTMCKYLVVVYGCTEGAFLTSSVLQNASDFMDFSCGTQIQLGSMKIVDESGEVAPVNQRGELHVKTEGMFTEYFNDEEKTNLAISDGWYKTDDLGRMDGFGNLRIEGRKSDMILTGTLTVNPSILEAAIKTCPGIENVAIVGIPDDVMYQLICACVILKAGSGLTEADVKSFCEGLHSENTEMFNVLPKHYMILDKFPETYTGKVSKKELTEIATKRFK